ncbi:MAG: hypothetical protein J6T85_03370 [Paludibacteraceae bacterium]|nr:hypothetical protein [Paludibacteraceae bacterium]
MKGFWKQYGDVILFAVTLFAADALWKLLVNGDERANVIAICGVDVSQWFYAIEVNIADAVESLVGSWREGLVRTDEITLHWPGGSGSRIVWSCTPVKQCFIWLCLLLTTRGGWWHKIWYIPAGWLLLYLFNILRIAIVTYVIADHPDWFELMHTYIMKYVFYGFMFLIWVLFVEVIRTRRISRCCLQRCPDKDTE